jgi:hypothetical protein
MKPGTTEPPITIRRYGRIPPPAAPLQRPLDTAPGERRWRWVAIACFGLGMAAGTAAAVTLLLR